MATRDNQFGIPYRTSSEIRASFIQFFVERGHKFIRSASIAPQDDPTILFTNSGMNQFKAIFLGDNREGLKRVANSQKCLRVSGKHNDLDEVGRDGTHHTFFEMLGNWSFGDYYKKEAITWAWELLTKVWKMPKDRLFVTVYKDDDEAAELWKSLTDVDPSRILRFEKENFWEMGSVGPCGPCSEIHFDLGDLSTQPQTYRDPVLGVNGANQRYIEIWNLVFMQYERLQDGSLKPLAATHVDTGSGLERVTSMIQGKTSNYDTDLFAPIIASIAKETDVPYDRGEKGVPHRVMADHVRALTFAIADGVTPGNEGRGYVMRRILRRASRFAHSLGQKEPILFKLVPGLVELMREAYPEVAERQSYIMQVIEAEEGRFLKTLDQGLVRLDKLIEQLKKEQKTEISGEDVFLFHDTYGFPYDLTQILAGEKGLGIDQAGYEACMAEQRERARKAAKFDSRFASEESWQILSPGKETTFTGYQSLQEKVKVRRYLEAGDTLYLVLDRTPFYAEAGGQVGDMGLIASPELELRVEDTLKILEMHVHKCSLIRGLLTKENLQNLVAEVDLEARERTKRNHSATHLLHAALKTVLGEHVNQQGSYVGPDRLRFDFTHHKGVTKPELIQIEDLVNAEVRKNHRVETEVMPFAQAKESGAVALFGEKYGDTVRVLTMGPMSKEFCGGTHVHGTGDIALFRLVSEASIAAGVRRIEAVTGEAALKLMQEDRDLLSHLSQSLKVKPEGLGDRVEALNARVKELEKKQQELRGVQLQAAVDRLVATHKEAIGSGLFSVVAALDRSQFASDELQSLLDALAGKMGKDGVAFLTHVQDGALSLLAAVGSGVQAKVKAGDFIKEMSKLVDGRGGGRADRARAGSKQVEKESAVLAAAREHLRRILA